MIRPMDGASHPRFLDLLACPECKGGLKSTVQLLRCSSCKRTYPLKEGIPVFVDEEAADHDELDHLGHETGSHGQRDHKTQQAAWFDRAEQVEFEIERPVGTPALYRFLLLEKFRRAVKPLGERLDGSTALAVCGGSGMDAELLASTGASVISSDISIGAAKRARERARRHGVALFSIVADVEHLPFRDCAIDLVYVHDGLHHLAQPERGLHEMARVARRWLSINEPARATATQFAVKVGVALEREESGNVVARLHQPAVERELHAAGFNVIQSQRYAMYYRHFPGRIVEALSRPGAFHLTVAGWRLANATVGRIGNKLSVVAERQGRSAS